MTDRVVDTNVLIAANGRKTHADAACQLACTQELRSLASDGIVAVDDRGKILAEYLKCVRHGGALGPGDAFYKHLVTYLGTPNRVHQVSISPNNDDTRCFDELPPNSFDRSDRKFLAVAVVADALVLNATDSDWAEQTKLMQDLGVEVRQLCPQHAVKQAKGEGRR